MKKSVKNLLKVLKNNSGRNNTGKITVRFRGGGFKRKYRKLNYNFEKSKIISKFYDPNRNALLALSSDLLTEEKYLTLLADSSNIGDILECGSNVMYKSGNRTQLKKFNLGLLAYNVSLYLNQRGKLARSGGTFIKIIYQNELKKVTGIRLPSGIIYYLNHNVFANIGTVSVKKLKSVKLKKAGDSRHLKRRPHVRGVAMNPVDHPHGGGEGKTSGGRCSVSPWGILTKGYVTNRKKKFRKNY